jgi:hypothetical protein
MSTSHICDIFYPLLSARISHTEKPPINVSGSLQYAVLLFRLPRRRKKCVIILSFYTVAVASDELQVDWQKIAFIPGITEFYLLLPK